VTSPQENTKVERMVEAIEALTVAVAVNVRPMPGRGQFENVKAARADLSDALREFLKPTLRVAGGTDTTRVIPNSNPADVFRFGPPKKQ
jgi:predicted amidohydrolase YtcJ